eukprot:m.142472 g.142472  ORF g.142472 m.142472 type:complete len:912 (+) comp24184_c1_seq17:46-2781(+)
MPTQNHTLSFLRLSLAFFLSTTITRMQPKQLTVVQLKEELRRRGAPVSGRKADLVKRLEVIMAKTSTAVPMDEDDGQDDDDDEDKDEAAPDADKLESAANVNDSQPEEEVPAAEKAEPKPQPKEEPSQSEDTEEKAVENDDATSEIESKTNEKTHVAPVSAPILSLHVDSHDLETFASFKDVEEENKQERGEQPVPLKRKRSDACAEESKSKHRKETEGMEKIVVKSLEAIKAERELRKELGLPDPEVEKPLPRRRPVEHRLERAPRGPPMAEIESIVRGAQGDVFFLTDLNMIIKHQSGVRIEVTRTDGSGLKLSEWDAIEKIETLARQKFVSLKRDRKQSTPLCLVFTGELKSGKTVDEAIASLHGKNFKVAGNPARFVLKVESLLNKEAVLNTDWKSKFSPREFDSLRPGDRPDTIIVRSLPSLWFPEESTLGTREEALKKGFSVFGDVTNVCVAKPKTANEPATDVKAKLKSLEIDVYVQYRTYRDFLYAFRTMTGRQLVRDVNGRVSGVMLDVRVDTSGFLTDAAIRQRKYYEQEEQRRQRQKEEHEKKMAERRKREEEERQRKRERREKEEEERRQREEEEEEQRRIEEAKRREEEERLEKLRREEEERQAEIRRHQEERRRQEEEVRRAEEERRRQEEEEKARKEEEERRVKELEEEERRLRARAAEARQRKQESDSKPPSADQEEEMRERLLAKIRASEEKKRRIMRKLEREKDDSSPEGRRDSSSARDRRRDRSDSPPRRRARGRDDDNDEDRRPRHRGGHQEDRRDRRGRDQHRERDFNRRDRDVDRRQHRGDRRHDDRHDRHDRRRPSPPGRRDRRRAESSSPSPPRRRRPIPSPDRRRNTRKSRSPSDSRSPSGSRSSASRSGSRSRSRSSSSPGSRSRSSSQSSGSSRSRSRSPRRRR